MAQLRRPGLSAGQKAELWARFKAGESFTAIARALGKPVGSIYGVDLLVLARSDSGLELEMQPVELDAILMNAMGDVRHLA